MRGARSECEHSGVATVDDDGLFPRPPVEDTSGSEKKEEPGPVEKSFRPYDPNQIALPLCQRAGMVRLRKAALDGTNCGRTPAGTTR